jgi:4-hydroxy-tetrahydrodipicolinate synthase
MIQWSGVFPAVTTKLNQDGSIDLEATGAGIDRLIANGVSGITVLPMLRENASIPIDEKEKSSVPPRK